MGNTYGDVRTKFISRMNRRDMTTDMADGFLQDAIKRIQRTLRIPAMEASVSLPVDSTYTSNGGFLIPNDYIKLRRISWNDTSFLQREDESRVLPASADTGIPQIFCRRGSVWVLGPTPDQNTATAASVVRVDYWAEFPQMLVTTDETILTDIADDLMTYGALSYACDHFSDKRGDKFEARYLQIAGDIEGQADDDELSGGAAVQPAHEYDDDLEGTF